MNCLENGPYPYFLKKRILAKTGHLSNEACAAELSQFAQEGTTRFVLAHLSAENNLPDLAYVTSQAALQEAGLRAGVDLIRSFSVHSSPLSLQSVTFYL